MQKNDKIIATVGVIILIIAAIGVYYWVPDEAMAKSVDGKVLFHITGDISNHPESITVSDCSPFYAIIATPLAVY